MRARGLAGAYLLSDGKPFSSGGGDAATDACGWDEVVFGNLHATIQLAAPDAGAFVRGSL